MYVFRHVHLSKLFALVLYQVVDHERFVWLNVTEAKEWSQLV